MVTNKNSEISAFEMPIKAKGARKATLLSMSAGVASRLFNHDTVFIPSIDRNDEDSTRKGPTAAFRTKGYQRPAEPARVRKIGTYYREDDLLGFTTPVIASVRRGVDHFGLVDGLKESVAGTRSDAAQFERLVAVIDGQHRLRGVIEEYERDSSLETDLVILCVHNLSYEEETEVFDVINTTPKRLPKALTEWNKFGITDSKSSDNEQVIRQIAVALGTDKDSVWDGRVNLTGTGRDPSKKVTLEGLRRSTENMFKGSSAYMPYREKLELAKLFWKSVADTFPEAWSDQQEKKQLEDGRWVETGSIVKIDGKDKKIPAVAYRLTDLVGVASLAKLAGDIITESRGNINPNVYITAEVKKLHEVDWRKTENNPWTNGQAGFAGQKGTYEALGLLRANGYSPFEGMVKAPASDNEDE